MAGASRRGDASWRGTAGVMQDAESPDGLPLTEEELVEHFVPQLKHAHGDPAALRRVLARYRAQGDHLGSQLLIDVLCISEDLLGQAGFTEAEAQQAMELYDSLSREEIERARQA